MKRTKMLGSIVIIVLVIVRGQIPEMSDTPPESNPFTPNIFDNLEKQEQFTSNPQSSPGSSSPNIFDALVQQEQSTTGTQPPPDSTSDSTNPFAPSAGSSTTDTKPPSQNLFDFLHFLDIKEQLLQTEKDLDRKLEDAQQYLEEALLDAADWHEEEEEEEEEQHEVYDDVDISVFVADAEANGNPDFIYHP